jgi:endonuclease G
MRSFLLFFIFFSTLTFADCPTLYPNSTPFNIPNTVELCNSFYVSDYDIHNHKTIAVSERLVHGSPIGTIKRTNDFHSDLRVGNNPNNNQYLHSHYDKGHMAPADDAASDTQMHETFLLTNMTPQSPMLNRVEWKHLEEHVRKLAKTASSDVFVVTIAIYDDNIKINNIPKPTGYWKIVFLDNSQQFYYADNKDNATVVQKNPVSIQSLFKKY